MEFEKVKRISHNLEAKQKALEPKQLFCKIIQQNVTVIIEHWNYKGKGYPSEIGEIFCSNILDCYQNGIKCKYSGISKFFPDPFDKNFNDEFYKEYLGEKEFRKILKIRKQKEKSKKNYKSYNDGKSKQNNKKNDF